MRAVGALPGIRLTILVRGGGLLALRNACRAVAVVRFAGRLLSSLGDQTYDGESDGRTGEVGEVHPFESPPSNASQLGGYSSPASRAAVSI